MHVFMSYSHADEDRRNELEKHLAALKRQGAITTWHDRRIVPGDELHGQISERLDTADIICCWSAPTLSPPTIATMSR